MREQLAYRLPAEWEPHERTWLAWPRKVSDYSPKFEAAQWAFCEVVRKLARTEKVGLLVDSPDRRARAEKRLRQVGADLGRVEFVELPMDRGWCRDMLPSFVHGPGGLVAMQFAFTGWARYPDHQEDAQVGRRLAEQRGWKLVEPARHGRRVVLEGGGLDANGRGTLLVTEEWLLDPTVQVRNPGFGKADYEALFQEWFGVTNVLWLGRGIAGDDTHGHIDDLCRFVNPTTVVLAMEDDPARDNFSALVENRERLRSMRLEDGSAIGVVELPMPEPMWFDGLRLPASYANFLIGDEVVLVPVFNDPNDARALGILAECFPGREVCPIAAVDLILGLGSLHCLSHEQPLASIEA